MKKNMIRSIICLIAAALILSTAAFAAEPVDLTKECALLIQYNYEGEPVVGAKFDLYRVGDLAVQNDEYYISLSGDFKDYPVLVNGLNNDAFQKAADTLASYAVADGHTPLASLVTDHNGAAEKRGLTSGLYLLIGHPLKTDKGDFTIKNHLLLLPNATNTAGPWSYELQLLPKSEFTPAPDPVDLQVVKVWDDKASGGYYRPNYVRVNLYRDGLKFDTVVLRKSNNWRHEWKDLDGAYAWSVTEEVPAKYTVSITIEGTKYILTNTCKLPPPTTPKPNIPQTGQVWWPVPVMVLFGAALIAVGLIRRKEDEV